jgi:hypothetical protein
LLHAASENPPASDHLLRAGEPVPTVWRSGHRLAAGDPVAAGDVLQLVTAIAGG